MRMRSVLEAGDQVPGTRTEVVAGQREGNVRLEEAELVPAVEAPPLEGETVERLPADELRHRVGQLDFAARTRLAPRQLVEDLGQEDVAADDGQVRRRRAGRRLLDQPLDRLDLSRGPARIDDAVAPGVLVGDFHRCEDRKSTRLNSSH